MIEITDSNDNSPIFSPIFYSVDLSENTTFDHPVESVQATDADTGTNSQLTYAIVGGNVNNAFYIKDPTVCTHRHN